MPRTLPSAKRLLSSVLRVQPCHWESVGTNYAERVQPGRQCMTHTFPVMRAVLPVVVAVPSGYVSIEELHQHGSQDLRSYFVGLTFQGAMLGMGHRLGKR